MAENSGVSGEVVYETVKKLKKDGWGFDAKNKRYTNLQEAGILDSTKVLRVALENAISTASTILLIDASIIPDASDAKKEGSGE